MAVISLPNGGGLGNLLFYHHVTYALSKKHMIQMYMNCDYIDEKRPNIRVYEKLFQHVEFINHTFQKDGTLYTEPNFFWNDIPYTRGTLFLRGYFQSYKYFWDVIPDIVSQFTKNLGETFMLGEYTELAQGNPCVCVHVRRTDYLNDPDIHTNLTEDYYVKGLKSFPDHRVLVFSDDTESIRHWDAWKSKNVHFVDEPDPLRTLWLMYRCDAFIIANSSLSLNAYLFAKGTRDTPGVAPSQWFGSKGPQFKIEDIVPPGTECLQ
jgi:hypothetical protein